MGVEGVNVLVPGRDGCNQKYCLTLIEGLVLAELWGFGRKVRKARLHEVSILEEEDGQ